MEQGQDSGQDIEQGTGQDPVGTLVRASGLPVVSGGGCVCPSCGFSIPQETGVQCYNKHCPKCGTIMTNKK